MMIFRRVGENTAIGMGLGGLLFLGFLFLIGILPFLSLFFFVIVAFWVLAFMLIPMLALYGIIYHGLTGRDARVPMPGAKDKRWAVETWMEGKGWIRLPTLTRNT